MDENLSVQSIIPEADTSDSQNNIGSLTAPNELQKTENASNEAISGVKVTRFDLPQRTFSRRDFLRGAAGIGLIGIAGYFGIKLLKDEERKSIQSIQPKPSVAVGGEFLENYRKNEGFNEQSAREWMQKEGIPSEDYGKIAAAGVSFISLTQEGQEFIMTGGTGGVAEYKGDYYLVTTTHVVDTYLIARLDESQDPKLLINIPGTQSMYSCNPSSIFTFNPRPDPKYDSPIFIKIEGDLAKEVDTLMGENKLSPFTPMQYSQESMPNVSQLRFQYGAMGLHDYLYKEVDIDSKVDAYRMVDTSGSASLCSGNSGAMALEKKDGRLNGFFLGLFTHVAPGWSPDGTTQPAMPDVHGVIMPPAECSVLVTMTSFGEGFFAQGIKEKQL